LKPLPVEEIEGGIFDASGNGQIVPVQIGDDPIVKFRHGDFFGRKFLHQSCPCGAALVVGEPFRQRLVFDNQVSSIVTKPVGDVVNLLQTVGFVIHRHDEIQGCVKLFEQIEDSHFVEIIEKNVGRGCAAVHDDQIRFAERGENRINFGWVFDVEKQGFRMKTLQR